MIEIKCITKDNLSFVQALEETLFSDPWGEKALNSWFSQPGAKGYLLLEDASPCAYVLFQSVCSEGELLRCGVLPKKKRKGLGFALLSSGLENLKNENVNRVFLEVRSENEPAKKLYEKLGFRLLGTRKNYYQKPTDHALIYEKNLME